MNRFFIKTITLILLVSILLSNFCYAITNDSLKNSLTKIFGSNIKIETFVENESTSGSSTTTYTAPSELIINDNQIILTETDGEASTSYKIDYLLENNTIEYIMDSDLMDLNLENNNAEESAMSLFVLLMLQNQSMQLCYLATADSLELDLEVANSYYSQLLSEQSETIEDETLGTQTTKYENDIFTYTVTSSGESVDNVRMLSSMIINLENLSKVTENNLDGTTKSVITITDTPVIDENEPEENLNTNTENNITENTTNTTQNTNSIENTVVNRNVIHLNTDNTVANTTIPAAGTNSSSFIIIFIIALGLFFYSRSKYYDEIL